MRPSHLRISALIGGHLLQRPKQHTHMQGCVLFIRMLRVRERSRRLRLLTYCLTSFWFILPLSFIANAPLRQHHLSPTYAHTHLCALTNRRINAWAAWLNRIHLPGGAALRPIIHFTPVYPRSNKVTRALPKAFPVHWFLQYNYIFRPLFAGCAQNRVRARCLHPEAQVFPQK